MTLLVKRKSELLDSPRHVHTHAYESVRMLLAEDGLDVTVTDITLAPGVEETYGSDDHLEIAYCLAGQAKLTDLESGVVHEVAPGTLWCAPRGSRFHFVASEPVRLVCVFRPAFEGQERGFAGENDDAVTPE